MRALSTGRFQFFNPLADVIHRAALFQELGQVAARLLTAERGQERQEEVRGLRPDKVQRPEHFQRNERRRGEVAVDNCLAQLSDRHLLPFGRLDGAFRLDRKRVLQPVHQNHQSSESQSEQSGRVVCRLPRKFVVRYPPQIGQAIGRVPHVGRLVPLAAHGLRSQVG